MRWQQVPFHFNGVLNTQQFQCVMELIKNGILPVGPVGPSTSFPSGTCKSLIIPSGYLIKVFLLKLQMCVSGRMVSQLYVVGGWEVVFLSGLKLALKKEKKRIKQKTFEHTACRNTIAFRIKVRVSAFLTGHHILSCRPELCLDHYSAGHPLPAPGFVAVACLVLGSSSPGCISIRLPCCGFTSSNISLWRKGDYFYLFGPRRSATQRYLWPTSSQLTA